MSLEILRHVDTWQSEVVYGLMKFDDSWHDYEQREYLGVRRMHVFFSLSFSLCCDNNCGHVQSYAHLWQLLVVLHKLAIGGMLILRSCFIWRFELWQPPCHSSLHGETYGRRRAQWVRRSSRSKAPPYRTKTPRERAGSTSSPSQHTRTCRYSFLPSVFAPSMGSSPHFKPSSSVASIKASRTLGLER